MPEFSSQYQIYAAQNSHLNGAIRLAFRFLSLWLRVYPNCECNSDIVGLVARTLVLTNDFPPRRGGIESFVKALADRLNDLPSVADIHSVPGLSAADISDSSVVVYTASMPGSSLVDPQLPYPVIRDRASTLLPTRRVRRKVVKTFRKYNCDRVLIGSSVPLGLLAPALRAAGAQKIVALTHGHEVMYARYPFARGLLRRVAAAVDYLPAITKWTRGKIGKALGPETSRVKQTLLQPGVDVEAFHPGAGGAEIRSTLGIPTSAPVVVCAARAVPRKGHDRLISAWPAVLQAVPDARLILVGEGPELDTLHRQAEHLGLGSPSEVTGRVPVIFVGAVPWPEVPAYIDAADVFVMLCRSHWLGFAEGFGIVFLEAAACGKPVIVGRSGGAPEAVLNGVSGYVVNPNDIDQIAARIIELLKDPEKAREMGARGRSWVTRKHTWDKTARELAQILLT